MTIENCQIDSWTGAAAITYNLRGPVTLFDNHFSNGPKASPVVLYLTYLPVYQKILST